LFIQIHEQIQDTSQGLVFLGPTDLLLSQIDVLVPDLLVLLTPNLPRIGEKKIDGPVDLVVEILSPSTRRRDLTLKRMVYERSKVAEYWIVDPMAKTVEQLVQRDGAFASLGSHEQEIVFRQLDDVRVDLTRVW
jgi:Uma2 family endonuclease